VVSAQHGDLVTRHRNLDVGPASWNGPDSPDADLFRPLRGPAGERLELAENMIVEKVLPAGTRRRLTEAELDVDRASYREPGESRRSTLS
jgi:haloalkane dehalogenase